jgi:hypothetical protein
MGGAKWTRRDHRRAGAGEAGDALDAGGLQRFCPAHRRQKGGEATRQPRRARPWGAQQEGMMGRTPASRSPSPLSLHVWVPVIADLRSGEGSRLPTCCAACAVPAGVPYASHAPTGTPPLSGLPRSCRDDPPRRVAVLPPLSPLARR